MVAELEHIEFAKSESSGLEHEVAPIEAHAQGPQLRVSVKLEATRYFVKAPLGQSTSLACRMQTLADDARGKQTAPVPHPVPTCALHTFPGISMGFDSISVPVHAVTVGAGGSARTDPMIGIEVVTQLAELVVVGVLGQPVTPLVES